MTAPRERCLVLKNDGLGDLVLASGLLADLAERYAVELVTCRANAEVAEAIPGLHRIHYVSRNGLLYHPRLLRWGGALSLALRGGRRGAAVSAESGI